MGVTWGGGEGDEERENKGEKEGIRMSFLSSIKKVLNIGQTEKKKKLVLQNIKVCTTYDSTFEVKILFYSHHECEGFIRSCENFFQTFYFLLDQDDVDPEQFWEIIGELGDGAFGKVIVKIHNFKEFLTSKDIFTPITSFWSLEILMRKRLKL